MKVSVEWMREYYDYYNAKYFNSELPQIAFEASTRMTQAWGLAEYYYAYDYKTEKVYAKDLKIKLSARYDIPENHLKNTLLHEMIHIEEYVKHFDRVFYKYNSKTLKIESLRYNGHGEWFLREANRINKDGWDIQPYITKEEEECIKKQVTSNGCVLIVVPMNYKWSKQLKKWVFQKDKWFVIYNTTDAKLKQLLKIVKTKGEDHKKKYKLEQDVWDMDNIITYKTYDADFCKMRCTGPTLLGWQGNQDFVNKFMVDAQAQKII